MQAIVNFFIKMKGSLNFKGFIHNLIKFSTQFHVMYFFGTEMVKFVLTYIRTLIIPSILTWSKWGTAIMCNIFRSHRISQIHRGIKMYENITYILTYSCLNTNIYCSIYTAIEQTRLYRWGWIVSCHVLFLPASRAFWYISEIKLSYWWQLLFSTACLQNFYLAS